jgi:hypothetical protein
MVDVRDARGAAPDTSARRRNGRTAARRAWRGAPGLCRPPGDTTPLCVLGSEPGKLGVPKRPHDPFPFGGIADAELADPALLWERSPTERDQ